MDYDAYMRPPYRAPGATRQFPNQDFPPGPRQEPEMAQATVIEPDDVFGRPTVAEAFQEYDFTDLSAKQIFAALVF